MCFFKYFKIGVVIHNFQQHIRIKFWRLFRASWIISVYNLSCNEKYHTTICWLGFISLLEHQLFLAHQIASILRRHTSESDLIESERERAAAAEWGNLMRCDAVLILKILIEAWRSSGIRNDSITSSRHRRFAVLCVVYMCACMCAVGRQAGRPCAVPGIIAAAQRHSKLMLLPAARVICAPKVLLFTMMRGGWFIKSAE